MFTHELCRHISCDSSIDMTTVLTTAKAPKVSPSYSRKHRDHKLILKSPWCFLATQKPFFQIKAPSCFSLFLLPAQCNNAFSWLLCKKIAEVQVTNNISISDVRKCHTVLIIIFTQTKAISIITSIQKYTHHVYFCHKKRVFFFHKNTRLHEQQQWNCLKTFYPMARSCRQDIINLPSHIFEILKYTSNCCLTLNSQRGCKRLQLGTCSPETLPWMYMHVKLNILCSTYLSVRNIWEHKCKYIRNLSL